MTAKLHTFKISAFYQVNPDAAVCTLRCVVGDYKIVVTFPAVVRSDNSVSFTLASDIAKLTGIGQHLDYLRQQVRLSYVAWAKTQTETL